MIWWMQGEADDGVQLDVQSRNIKVLIDMFRSEPWFTNSGYFLANETRVTVKVNRAIRQLGIPRSDDPGYRGNFDFDGDVTTDWSRGEDTTNSGFGSLFPAIFEEARGGEFAHFNEVGLRRIGDEVSNKYLNYVRRYR